MMKILIRALIIVATTLIAVVLLTRACGSGNKTHLGMKSVDWLPPSASNINLYETWGLSCCKIYECTIPESDFRTLALQKKWSLTETNNIYVMFRRVLGQKPLRIVGNAQMDIVSHALFFERRFQNGGGTTVVYDLETSRLYVDSSNRQTALNGTAHPDGFAAEEGDRWGLWIIMKSDQISLRYYQSDVSPEVGDRVRQINRENEEHIVVEVIDTVSKMKAFGQSWAGILIEDTRYGLVAEDMNDPELEFIARGRKQSY